MWDSSDSDPDYLAPSWRTGLTADHLVELIDALFASFDEIVEQCGLEKINTSGDACVAVAGIDPESSGYAEAAATAALRMREELARHPVGEGRPLEMRFGLHVGPVVAGVIGKRKFSYDLWGDTMNTASRMESTGVPGGIQVTADFCRHVRNAFRCEPRGAIDMKGKGEIETHMLIGHRADTGGGKIHHQP